MARVGSVLDNAGLEVFNSRIKVQYINGHRFPSWRQACTRISWITGVLQHSSPAQRPRPHVARRLRAAEHARGCAARSRSGTALAAVPVPGRSSVAPPIPSPLVTNRHHPMRPGTDCPLPTPTVPGPQTHSQRGDDARPCERRDRVLSMSELRVHRFAYLTVATHRSMPPRPVLPAHLATTR
jgi:hypothetical protein